MSPHALSWEHRLLAWAFEGLERPMPAEPLTIERRTLERAYRCCEQLTNRHSRTFYLASSLLPAAKRRAIRALYAFCRISDDLVDCIGHDSRGVFEDWCRRTRSVEAATADRSVDGLVALAWADVRTRYHIPARYVQQLLDGVAHDLDTQRYATFDDLAAYCYGVASTVGLMAMHIVGFSGPHAVPYAVKLGVALQLTNILRDVGEDWCIGRIYLPQDELAAFRVTQDDIAAGRVDERWRAFMRFQIERTHRLYAEAWSGIALLERDARFAIAAAAGLYRAILEDIEAHDMDVFRRRAHVGGWSKLRRLPGLWKIA